MKKILKSWITWVIVVVACFTTACFTNANQEPTIEQTEATEQDSTTSTSDVDSLMINVDTISMLTEIYQ